MNSEKSFFEGVEKEPKQASTREQWDQTKLDLPSFKQALEGNEVCYKATSLASVVHGRMYELGPDYPVWGHRLIESFCFFRFFKQFFQENLPVEGRRVFEAAFLACDDAEQTLVFHAFAKDTRERALFYARVSDFETYLTLRERFVERVEESGIMINRPRHQLQAALILGNWTDISEECWESNRCALFTGSKASNNTALCDRCYGKYLTVINNARQIYYSFIKD